MHNTSFRRTRRALAARLGITAAVLLGAGLTGLHTPVMAADYPDRPIKLISPYAPGGIADPVGRALAEGMALDLGQSVVVENKPGAGTMIGAAVVANAPPNGYTLLIATNALVLNPLLYKKMPYAANDLRVIAVVAEAPLVVAVSNKTPAKNMKEFSAYAKTVKQNLNYASVGRGNTLHLATELFKTAGGFDLQEIMYAGKSGEALMSVLTGEVDLFITVAAQATPQIQAGKLRALAVTTRERLKALPDVPTTAEAGFPDVVGATWYGVAVHTSTPEAIVDRLRASIDKVMKQEAFRTQFNALGLVVQEPRTVAEVTRFTNDERARSEPIIRKFDIRLD
jgi:tripartite-type tricarboxylate transporter receptor subunit TctC